MTRYAIDAATLVHLVTEELEVDPAHQLVAPSWIRSAAMELLLADVRAGARSEAESLVLHDRMTELKMRLLGDRVSRRVAWQVALEYDWSDLREAEYVAIARLQADALVTVDPAFAARAAAGATVQPVSHLLRPA